LGYAKILSSDDDAGDALDEIPELSQRNDHHSTTTNPSEVWKYPYSVALQSTQTGNTQENKPERDTDSEERENGWDYEELEDERDMGDTYDSSKEEIQETEVNNNEPNTMEGAAQEELPDNQDSEVDIQYPPEGQSVINSKYFKYKTKTNTPDPLITNTTIVRSIGLIRNRRKISIRIPSKRPRADPYPKKINNIPETQQENKRTTKVIKKSKVTIKIPSKTVRGKNKQVNKETVGRKRKREEETDHEDDRNKGRPKHPKKRKDHTLYTEDPG
jgi:hypothetical protein